MKVTQLVLLKWYRWCCCLSRYLTLEKSKPDNYSVTHTCESHMAGVAAYPCTRHGITVTLTITPKCTSHIAVGAEMIETIPRIYILRLWKVKPQRNSHYSYHDQARYKHADNGHTILRNTNPQLANDLCGPIVRLAYRPDTPSRLCPKYCGWSPNDKILINN